MSRRTWPLVFKTNSKGSHTLHISDENSKKYTCGLISRCGRDIRHTFCLGRKPAECFDDNSWKDFFRILRSLSSAKEPKLCERCGTREDFKQAHAEYLAAMKARNDEEEARRIRKNDIRAAIVDEINEQKRTIFRCLEDTPLVVELEHPGEDSDLEQIFIHVDGRRYKVIHDVAIDDEVHTLIVNALIDEEVVDE